MRLYFDFETRSILNPDEDGLDRYVNHPSTVPLMCAYAYDDGPVSLWETHKGPVPDDLREGLEDPFVTKVAWNARFEREIARLKLGLEIPWNEFLDVKVWAAYMSVARSLGESSEIFGLPQDQAKMKEGKQLIQLFSMPATMGGEDTLFGVSEPSFHDWNTRPAEWHTFGEYCKRDTEAERAILKKLEKFPLPAREQRGWVLDQIINMRGMPVDMELVNGATAVAETTKKIMRDKFTALTGIENPKSQPQCMKWLTERGYPFSGLAKGFVERVLNGEGNCSEDVKEALRLRKPIAMTSDSKLDRIRQVVSPDGRVRHLFKFLGSPRAGRWCIAEGSPVRVKTSESVVTEKPIESVLESDMVWDGEGWVNHGGVVFSGHKSEVLRYDGLTATPEHEVWVSDNTKIPLKEAAYACFKLWKGEDTPYCIYRLTSPSGGSYFGLTKNLKDRWGHHQKKASTGVNHPLYNAIRKYGADRFSVQVVDLARNKKEAQELERKHIAEANRDTLYNLSPGGEADGEFGGLIFWSRLNQNPAARKEYLHKLSEVKKSNDWSDYRAMTEAMLAWRKNHPRLAYKLGHRAVRIASKKSGRGRNTPKPEKPLKEQLMWKHRPSEARSRVSKSAVKKIWDKRTKEDRRGIATKIGRKAKTRLSLLSPEQLSDYTKTARSSIDRVKQGSAASAGLKRFWVNLKNDPVKYREYMERRTKTLCERMTSSTQAQKTDSCAVV